MTAQSYPKEIISPSSMTARCMPNFTVNSSVRMSDMQVRLKSLPMLQRYYLGLVSAVFIFGMTVPIPWTVSTEGFIEPSRKQFIKPAVGGVIAEVLAESGQEVIAGQVIARLSDPQIAIDRAADRAAFEKA